jgi:hypothetical protein
MTIRGARVSVFGEIKSHKLSVQEKAVVFFT